MIDLNNFSKKIEDLIFYLDDIEGKSLNREIKKEDLVKIKEDQGAYLSYLSLQFLIIPFLSTQKIGNLIKDHLTIGLSIDDIDLTERITKKLLSLDITDRDNCKKSLNGSLLINQQQITSVVQINNNQKINKTSEWIKDFVANINKYKGKILEEAEYFYKKSYFVSLPTEEKEILKKVFNLYKFLNTSSLDPEGFEDDLLLRTEDGKLITTKNGKVVVLYDYMSSKSGSLEKKARTVSGPPKTEGEKNIEKIQEKEKEYSEDSIERKALEEEIGREKEIENLQYMANKYSEGTLERRAIEEEIVKLSSSAPTDAKAMAGKKASADKEGRSKN